MSSTTVVRQEGCLQDITYVYAIYYDKGVCVIEEQWYLATTLFRGYEPPLLGEMQSEGASRLKYRSANR